MVSHKFITKHRRERHIQTEVPAGGFTSQSNRWFLECIKQMSNANRIFNTTRSEDFIADKTGRIDWVYSIRYPEKDDTEYHNFTNNIDVPVWRQAGNN